MLLLNSTSDLLRIVTSVAALIEVHASWVDISGTTITPGRQNTPHITTATTTTVVPSPGASTSRNVKHLNVTNDYPSASCIVTVEHTDGTTVIELIAVILLPGENLVFDESGHWSHRDTNGAEYPPAGLGKYNGLSIPFMKTGAAMEGPGYWHCTHLEAGFPTGWNPGTPGVNGRNTDGTTSADFGCIPIKNSSVGANFLTELNLAGSISHTHVFFDVLWVNHNLNVTLTTAQAISMGALPPRDVDGGTDGKGCTIAMLCGGSGGNASAVSNSTVSYTNSAGVSNRTATLTAIAGSQIPPSPVSRTIVLFNLQQGDEGVKSIQSVTLGTSLVSGTIFFMIIRDLAMIGTQVVNVAARKKISEPGIRLYNGTCALHRLLATSTAATFLTGELVVQEK